MNPKPRGPDAQMLRLVLGDQLNPLHSWFAKVQDDVVFVMMEIRQETDYVLHHAQKLIAIFAAMRDFAELLASRGHRVHYLRIDDPENRQSLIGNLDAMSVRYRAKTIEYQEPDEWRLDHQLAEYAGQATVQIGMVESEHFLTERSFAANLFEGRRHWRMETFYRHMRVRHRVLIAADERPAGGRWNFDSENRKSWPGRPAEPPESRTLHDHSKLWSTITAAGVESFGEPCAAQFAWPLNRVEALWQLDAFIAHGLASFGDYQDSMSQNAPRLFHSLLSFALNTKMLNPREVIGKAEEAWANGTAPLAAVEGFIRQILGWREFVRGVYWSEMPDYPDHNTFGHRRDLPSWFWDGKTRMNCMAQAIGQSLEQAYAHHIQRLMVIGNFALLAGLDPKQVCAWYLGVYIDAFEWVELPNTLGMSQFADGGLLASKPYVSSAAYIDRMSDYCKDCFYDKKVRVGPKACPYNALYWSFFARHSKTLLGNARLALVYRQLNKMPRADLEALTAQAIRSLESIDSL